METTSKENHLMSPNKNTNVIKGAGLIAIGVAIGAAGIYVGETDDAPGAALIGILLMIVAMILGVKTARRNA